MWCETEVLRCETVRYKIYQIPRSEKAEMLYSKIIAIFDLHSAELCKNAFT